jgi:hypothetical protein
LLCTIGHESFFAYKPTRMGDRKVANNGCRRCDIISRILAR